MIEKSQSISMSEAIEYVQSEENVEIKGFMKKFIKLDAEKAKELRDKIEALDLMKIRSEHVSKIIDILPKKKEELSKIFTDVSLDEDESTKVLDVIKEFQ